MIKKARKSYLKGIWSWINSLAFYPFLFKKLMRSSDKGIVYIILEKWYGGAKELTELIKHFTDEDNLFWFPKSFPFQTYKWWKFAEFVKWKSKGTSIIYVNCQRGGIRDLSRGISFLPHVWREQGFYNQSGGHLLRHIFPSKYLTCFFLFFILGSFSAVYL